jgi:hypothetical protein
VARSVLDGPSRVTFFQAIGRRYAIAGTGSLLVAIGAGLALAWPPSSWSGTIDSAVALAGILVLATAVGMAQAHAMTTLRRRAMSNPEDHDADRAVRRDRRHAGVLRGLMALVTLVIVVLAAQVITHGAENEALRMPRWPWGVPVATGHFEGSLHVCAAVTE